MIKFASLLLALGLIMFPFVLHLDRKIFNKETFKATLSASLISGFIFCTITLAMRLAGLLLFNVDKSMGIALEFQFCLRWIGFVPISKRKISKERFAEI
jgi:hypothetical protein